ncbi:MAG: ATP-binding cassette domain-containing protein [Armatimonadetes bacterium]|nr:ATP-binding cassette domain-containing protein [Armatimonadota bacterium]
MIRVRDLTHRFGTNTVLQGVSLDVFKGETVAVMGSSGGGKTTLLRCMAGLLEPTCGCVELFGKDIQACKPRELEEIRRKVGVVFQGAALFDYLDVADNISFAAVRQRSLGTDEVLELVAKSLETVGLVDTGSLYPNELSGGMRKRVGIARALATDPEILFYDEPTSGLDPVTAYAIDGLIKEVDEKLQATSILVTHDLNSALRVADRIVFLHTGSIIFDDSPAKFVEFDDPRVAEVIEKARSEKVSVSDVV